MRVVIAGAGSVGRSIARELLHNDHQVLLIDRDADEGDTSRVPDAQWLLADACEITALDEAEALEKGMEVKSIEFIKAGAEVYSKV